MKKEHISWDTHKVIQPQCITLGTIVSSRLSRQNNGTDHSGHKIAEESVLPVL